MSQSSAIVHVNTKTCCCAAEKIFVTVEKDNLQVVTYEYDDATFFKKMATFCRLITLFRSIKQQHPTLTLQSNSPMLCRWPAVLAGISSISSSNAQHYMPATKTSWDEPYQPGPDSHALHIIPPATLYEKNK